MILNNLYEVEEFSYGKYLVKRNQNISTYRNFVFSPHWHKHCEIILICSGKLNVTYNGKSFTAKPNDMLYFQPNALHSGISDYNGCFYKVIQFNWCDLLSSTPAEKQLSKKFEDGYYSFENKIVDLEAIKLFDRVFQITDTNQAVQPIAEKCALYNYLSYLIENYLLVYTEKSTRSDKFNDVIKYIHENYTMPLSTDVIANKFGYNPQYFCRLFKSKTQFTFKEYLNLCRIEKAQILIQEQKYDLSTIATMCGFNNTSYFSTIFKEYTNMTPSQYKSQFK